MISEIMNIRGKGTLKKMFLSLFRLKRTTLLVILTLIALAVF